MPIADGRFKVDTKVLLTLATHPDEEAIVLQQIPPALSSAPYGPIGPGAGAALGDAALPFRYRVQVVRTGQELIVDEEDARPTEDTEFDEA
jgi:hypothetical protein